MATAASPLTFAFLPVRSSSTALITVRGITIIMSPVPSIRGFIPLNSAPVMDDTAIAPNATCDSPSPINENRFSTSVTPKSEAHSATSTPTIRA